MPEPELGPTPAVPSAFTAQRIEDLSTRVAAVWIWTVLFGVNGGLSYGMSQSLGVLSNPVFLDAALRNRGPMGMGPGREWLAILLPMCSVTGILASVAAWGFLYLYFSLFLLPLVLRTESAEPDPRRRRMAAAALRRAYLLTMVAGLCRLLPDVLPYLMILVSSF